MADSLKYKIFLETDCIPEETMFDYIDKKLSAKECHSLEKHLLQCDLCSDAMEGLELTKNRERITAINQKINERIAAPEKETKVIVFYYKLFASIAASILLLIGGVFFFNQFNQKQELAEFKHDAVQSLSQPPAPPPPPPFSSISNDEKMTESGNSIALKTSIEVGKLETKAKVSSNKKIIRDQQSALAEEQAIQPDYKTSISTGAGATSNAGDTRRSIMQTEGNVNEITIPPAQSFYEAPQKESTTQHTKDDDKLDEMEKSAGLAGISDKSAEKLSEPTVSKALSEAPASGKNEPEDVKREEAKKSTGNYSMYRANKSKEKKEAPKENPGVDASKVVASAPQSVAANDANYETATTLANSEQEPVFPGGQDSLIIFIHNNFKYPENFKKETLSSTKIVVTFIVNTKGEIKKAKIVKGINSELDKEALRVLSIMPNWKPGTLNGKALSLQVNLPIQLE